MEIACDMRYGLTLFDKPAGVGDLAIGEDRPSAAGFMPASRRLMLASLAHSRSISSSVRAMDVIDGQHFGPPAAIGCARWRPTKVPAS